MTEVPLRSVSQINQYLRCPQSFKLSRIDKVWARPAAWLPQGSAVHTVLERFELALAGDTPMTLEEALDLFRAEYSKEIARYTDGPDEARRTPNFDWWSWSGPYNGERDIERRYEIGLEQVEKFVAWRFTKGQEIWTTPDGKPAVELAFSIDLGARQDPACSQVWTPEGEHVADCDCRDGIRVRGFIDAVVVENGELRVRDYKTGNSPGDDFQLGVYALAVNTVYGTNITTGDYFMAGKKGKRPVVTAPYDLTEWTRERVSERFHEVEARIQAGDFEPDPEPSKCQFCDVRLNCPVFSNNPA